MEPLPQSPEYQAKYVARWPVLAGLAIAIALWHSATAQLTTPAAIGVRVSPITGALLESSTNLFKDNQELLLQYAVARTNGVIADADITGSAEVKPSATLIVETGASFVAQPGSIVLADRVTITGDPYAAPSSSAVPKTYVDQQETITRALLDARAVNIVANLADLKNLATTQLYSQLAVVRSNTGSDGAKGQWIWDPIETAAESPVIKKSNGWSLSDPGRWIKQ